MAEPLTTRETLLRQAMLADEATYGPIDLSAPGAKTDDEIAVLFNTPGPGAANVDVFDVDTQEVISLITHTEYPTPTTLLPGADAYLRTLLVQPRIRVTAQTKAGFLSIFNAQSATRAALSARFVRKETRAEALEGWPNGEPVAAYPEVFRARNLSS